MPAPAQASFQFGAGRATYTQIMPAESTSIAAMYGSGGVYGFPIAPVSKVRGSPVISWIWDSPQNGAYHDCTRIQR